MSGKELIEKIRIMVKQGLNENEIFNQLMIELTVEEKIKEHLEN